jgi:hypothetical protein
MCDVLVTQILLNRSRIVPVVRKLIATGMAEHVRVNGKWEFRLSTSPGDDLADR